MDEYRMSAFAVYADGTSGDAFAEVSELSLATCFAAMAGEVAVWLPQALGGEEVAHPQAIELMLEWSGAPARSSMSEQLDPPGDGAECRPHPRRRTVRCVAARRLGCAGSAGLPIRPAVVSP